MSRRSWLEFAIALALAVVVGVLAGPALHQGFDSVAQGGPLLSARALLDGSGTYDGGTTAFADSLLAAWLFRSGESLASLARWNLLLTVLTTGLGAWMLLRSGRGTGFALAWTVAVLAATPPSAGWTTVVLVAWGAAFIDGSWARQFWLGAGWAVVSALDPRVGVASLPVLVAALPRRAVSPRAVGWGVVVAWSLVAVVVLLAAGPSGLGSRGVLATAHDLGTRVGDGEIFRFVRTALSGRELDAPFGGWPRTGETVTSAWSGQGAMRALALRAIVVVAIAGATIPLVRSSMRRKRPASILAWAFCLSAVLALMLRGDVNGLRQASLLVVGALAAWPLAGRTRWIAAAVACLVLAPLAAETAWRGTHPHRPGLVTWQDPHGGVRVEATRAQAWTQARGRLVPAAGEPVLIWPVDPGVHFLLGTTPSIADADIPEGRTDDLRVSAALAARPPRLVLLGPEQELLGHRLRARLPKTWEFLRERYRFAAVVRLEDDDLRVLAPFGGSATDPLAQRLPTVELTIANDRTPALRRGFAVGQGVTLGDRDLEGFAVRVRTSGRDLLLELRVQVWQKRAAGYDAALTSENVQTRVAGDGAMAWFRLPVEDTAGREIAITFELRNELRDEVRLDWYVHDEAHEPDFYPEGSALLGLDAVDADLYFLVY